MSPHTPNEMALKFYPCLRSSQGKFLSADQRHKPWLSHRGHADLNITPIRLYTPSLSNRIAGDIGL